MKLEAIALEPRHVEFVDRIFAQNIEILHGSPISPEEWRRFLFTDPDPLEKNFIITADGRPAAWLKLNGLHKQEICLSMLVVAGGYKRRGIGGFAVRFAERFAVENGRSAVIIHTTQDNTAAVSCYLKQGYAIEKEIRYAVGDGIVRDGYLFRKNLGRTANSHTNGG